MKKKTLFRRFTRLIKITFRNVLLRFEDPIKVMEYKLEESKDTIRDLEHSTTEMQVNYNMLLEEIKSDTSKVSGYQAAIDIALRDNDEAAGTKAVLMLDKLQVRLASKETQAESMEQMLETLRHKIETLRTKHAAMKSEYEALKSENEFAKSMSKINQELRDTYSDDVDFSEMEEMKQKVRKNMHYQKELSNVIASESDEVSEIDRAKATFQKLKAKQEEAGQE